MRRAAAYAIGKHTFPEDAAPSLSEMASLVEVRMKTILCTPNLFPQQMDASAYASEIFFVTPLCLRMLLYFVASPLSHTTCGYKRHTMLSLGLPVGCHPTPSVFESFKSQTGWGRRGLK